MNVQSGRGHPNRLARPKGGDARPRSSCAEHGEGCGRQSAGRVHEPTLLLGFLRRPLRTRPPWTGRGGSQPSAQLTGCSPSPHRGPLLAQFRLALPLDGDQLAYGHTAGGHDVCHLSRPCFGYRGVLLLAAHDAPPARAARSRSRAWKRLALTTARRWVPRLMTPSSSNARTSKVN